LTTSESHVKIILSPSAADFTKSEVHVMKKSPKTRQINCETCVFYDYDDELDAYICTVNLDEDELERFVLGRAENCPYYRFYDEYKSVQKQN